MFGDRALAIYSVWGVMQAKMDAALTAYTEMKFYMWTHYGIAENVAHVHGGLFAFLAATVAFRQRLSAPGPLALVYFLALANELADFLSPRRPYDGWNSLLDVANTVVWPTVLFLLDLHRASRGSAARMPDANP